MVNTYFTKANLELNARKVLEKYDPEYFFKELKPIPIEDIAENVYGLEIDYMRLTLDGEVLGKMIYADGYSPRYSDEKNDYELISVHKGTILIESRLLDDPKQYGRFRFTLAHELAHWILHKKVFQEEHGDIETEQADRIEWQANFFATSLMMPRVLIKRYFYQMNKNNKRYQDIVNEISDFFEVSKQAMQFRLHELNLD